MQYRESLFQIDGSNALKTHAAAPTARIIEFPKQQSATSQKYSKQRSLLSGVRSLGKFARTIIHTCDEAFSVSWGTAKGVGPRFATKRETALVLGTCALATFLTLML